MRVSTFYPSSVQLGMPLVYRIYTRALTKHLWYNTMVSPHPDMRRLCDGARVLKRLQGSDVFQGGRTLTFEFR